MSKRKSNGSGRVGRERPGLEELGIASPMPASSWARPMVATIRMRRGAFSNRRITTNSVAEPERDRDDERERHRDPVRPSVEPDERDRDARGHGAEVGLREVDDPVRAVDQHDPDREQRDQRADHDAPGDHARPASARSGGGRRRSRRWRRTRPRPSGARCAWSPASTLRPTGNPRARPPLGRLAAASSCYPGGPTRTWLSW